MKTKSALLILFLSLFIQFYAAANEQKILSFYVKSQSLSDEDFKKQIIDNSLKDLNSNFQSHPSFISSETIEFDNSVESISSIIDRYEKTPLLESEYEILLSLYLKLHELQMNFSTERLIRIYSLFIRFPQFQDLFPESFESIKTKINKKVIFYSQNQLNELFKGIDTENESIYIDGIKIIQNEKTQATRSPHQWMLISNNRTPIVFFGLLDQFKYQMNQSNLWIENCNKKLNFLGLSNITIEIIAPDCKVLSVADNKGENNSIRKSSDKSWIIPTAVVLSVLTAYSLKDKKIALKLPTLKF